MRTISTLLFLLIFWHSGVAQGNLADTLIVEPVVGDPISLMLTTPSGFDDGWVNYDQDLGYGYCVHNGNTPLGWYIERDFGLPDSDPANNEAFTSCSYLDGGIRNHNWLILPPVYIPDSTYQLCWRSLVFEGPAFTDGYKVLASTFSNLPASGDYSNVLFVAAEMVKPKEAGVYTLDPNDYVFSDGYIHANGFTDTSYFFLPAPDAPYRGRMEPHCASLAAFATQTIYIAFHHDSKDDSQLQLDDIVISNDNAVAVHQPGNILDFSIVPNPAVATTFVRWTMKKPEPGQMQLHDLSGKLVLEKHFSAYENGQLFVDLQTLPTGVYHCSLITTSGHSTRKLVKL